MRSFNWLRRVLNYWGFAMNGDFGLTFGNPSDVQTDSAGFVKRLPDHAVYSMVGAGDGNASVFMGFSDIAESKSLRAGCYSELAANKADFTVSYEASGTTRDLLSIKADQVTGAVRHVLTGVPVYASDAAADADVTLYPGSLYKLAGRAIFQKP